MATILRASGLSTNPNNLTNKESSLTEAINTVIDRDNVIQPRRGFKQYGNDLPLTTDRAKQLMTYKDRIFRHFNDVLQFDNGSGSFTSFDGSYTETSAGLRIKFIEANSNFYFTTSAGIQKISATSAAGFSASPGYIRLSGVAQALDLSGNVNYAIPGYLPAISRVAYRVVFGYYDENRNLILSAPSVRTVVTNYSEADFLASVDLQFTIPEDVNTTNYFYQVYRTATVTSTTGLAGVDALEPGEEFNLVFQSNLTPAEITAGFINVNDITPETFRDGGAPLYTNPLSGEGILQSNDRPPIATDITLFNGSTFYSNTQTAHTASLNLLGLDDFVSGVSQLIISSGGVTNVYTFVGEREITQVVTVSFASLTDASFWLINGPSNERNYFVWYNKTGTTLAPISAQTVGRIPIEVDVSGLTTSTDIADATTLAINTVAAFDFTASNVGATMTITNVNNGYSDDAVDSSDAPTTFTITTTQQGAGEDIANQEILLSGLPTPAQQVDDTTRSIVKVVNRNPNETVYVTYLSDVDSVPGEMTFERRDLSNEPFYISVNNPLLSDQFDPILPSTVTITSISTGASPTITTGSPHGLSIGDTVVLYGTDSTPSIDGSYLVVTAPTATTFTITVSAPVTIAGTTGFAFEGTFVSDNEVNPNRVYFSKYQQPEAVPSVNFIDVGPRDEPIQRILALRDSLFIIKSNSVYRLSGDIAPNFSVSLLDSGVECKAPDSATILNNLIYLMTNQDISTISETGVSIISRPIEDQLIRLTDFNSFAVATFGVSYEKDRAYLLFTVTSANDTVATQCFRYNTFTNAWTKWDVTKTCGIVNDFNDVLYLGAADENFIEIERKNLNRTDHADRQFDLDVIENGVSGSTVELSNVNNIEIGDTVVQTQYLTIARFNRLLRKLDNDYGVGDSDYYSTLQMVAGDNLTQKMSDLVAKLNADPSLNLTYTFTGSTVFSVIQQEYNDNIIANFNNITENTVFKDYQESTGTYDFEATNVIVDQQESTIQTLYPLSLMVGTITIYKAIPTSVIWTPQHFGDPAILKQVKEGTLIFENNVFTTAQVAYASDLSPSFDEISFSGQGIGDWGFFVWSDQNWGGEGSQVPLRTLIPRNKQRCRFLKPKFLHKNAREQYALYGISLDPRELSQRAYK